MQLPEPPNAEAYESTGIVLSGIGNDHSCKPHQIRKQIQSLIHKPPDTNAELLIHFTRVASSALEWSHTQCTSAHWYSLPPIYHSPQTAANAMSRN